jgi:hypothetical protein
MLLFVDSNSSVDILRLRSSWPIMQVCEEAVDRIREMKEKPIPVNIVVTTKG